MRMTERDYRVLEALEKWGALGLGQIDAAFYRRPEEAGERMRLYFNEIDRRDYWFGAYKRMDMLRRLKLVRIEQYINHHQTYLLTTAGHRMLKSLGRSALMTFRPTMPEMYLEHELTVAGIGLILEETLGRRILSNRQLYETRKRDGRPARKSLVMPDMWISDKQRPCAVEVELCQKSAGRYKELWGEYRRYMPQGGRVLYVTGWESLGDILLRIATEERFPLLHVASLKEFKAMGERCRFVAPTVNRDTGKSDEFIISPQPASARVGGDVNEEIQVAGRQS